MPASTSLSSTLSCVPLLARPTGPVLGAPEMANLSEWPGRVCPIATPSQPLTGKIATRWEKLGFSPMTCSDLSPNMGNVSRMMQMLSFSTPAFCGYCSARVCPDVRACPEVFQIQLSTVVVVTPSSCTRLRFQNRNQSGRIHDTFSNCSAKNSPPRETVCERHDRPTNK